MVQYPRTKCNWAVCEPKKGRLEVIPYVFNADSSKIKAFRKGDEAICECKTEWDAKNVIAETYGIKVLGGYWAPEILEFNDVAGLIYGGRDVFTEEALKSKFFTGMVKNFYKKQIKEIAEENKTKKEIENALDF